MTDLPINAKVDVNFLLEPGQQGKLEFSIQTPNGKRVVYSTYTSALSQTEINEIRSAFE